MVPDPPASSTEERTPSSVEGRLAAARRSLTGEPTTKAAGKRARGKMSYRRQQQRKEEGTTTVCRGRW